MSEGNPLHRLLEELGVKIEVLESLESTLHRIEARYVKMGARMTIGSIVVAIAVVASLSLGGCALRSISDAQDTATDAARRADVATAQLALVSAENRTLIKRLEQVAVEAQDRGRKTDVQQCHEINSLRRSIREVLMIRGGESLLPLFKDKGCMKLPNRKPVTP